MSTKLMVKLLINSQERSPAIFLLGTKVSFFWAPKLVIGIVIVKSPPLLKYSIILCRMTNAVFHSKAFRPLRFTTYNALAYLLLVGCSIDSLVFILCLRLAT